MNDRADHELLQEYGRCRSNAAFAELVQRYVDLVYSAACRLTRDKSSAEDVTQEVFMALAKNARSLDHHPVLAGWLHRTTHNLASNAIRASIRRQSREQEAARMNELLANATEPGWEKIAPELDAALADLSEPDRDAVLLRYFQRKSAEEMAETLGISGEAAQKRVSRAVEHLRQLLAARGLTVGTGALVVVITANAVQAAPPNLIAAVFTAATVGGGSVAAYAAKTIVMTTLQKTVVGTALVVAVGTGLFEHRQTSILRAQVEAIRQREAPLAEQLQNAQKERADALQQNSALRDENQRLKNETAELVKLRGQVAGMRRSIEESKSSGQRPSKAGAGFVSADQFAEAGLATPASSIQTMYWAALSGNPDRCRQAIVWGEGAITKWREMHRDENADPNSIWPTPVNPHGRIEGFEIVGQREIAPDRQELQLAVYLKSTNAVGDSTETRDLHTLQLVQRGGEWKWSVPSLGDFVSVIPVASAQQ